MHYIKLLLLGMQNKKFLEKVIFLADSLVPTFGLKLAVGILLILLIAGNLV